MSESAENKSSLEKTRQEKLGYIDGNINLIILGFQVSSQGNEKKCINRKGYLCTFYLNGHIYEHRL